LSSTKFEKSKKELLAANEREFRRLNPDKKISEIRG